MDGSGNIYAFGAFQGTLNFGTDTSSHSVSLTSSDTAPYLVKYASDGTLLWAVMPYDFATGTWQNLAVDSQGDVFLTDGPMRSTLNFEGQQRTFPSPGAILAEYSASDGSFRWVDQFDVIRLAGVATDASGNAYITGSFGGTTDFDPGPGTDNLFSGGSSRYPNQAAYVVKLNNNGSLAWAEDFQATGSSGRFQSSSNSQGWAIAVDGSGNVYAAGRYGGTVDFNPATGRKDVYNLPTTGGDYVTKLDTTGQLVWAKQVNSGAGITGLAIDPSSGNIDLTGGFSGTVNFNPAGTFNLTSLDSAGDIYVEQLNSAGNFNWAVSAGGSGWDYPDAIAVDGSGDIFVVGYFQSDTLNFDPQHSLTAQSPQDGFLWKLTP